MQSTFRVLVMTSDKYLPAIRVFAYLFNKYWKPTPEVVVSGFSQPNFKLPDNFSFLSVGKMEDFPFDKWSNALYKTLEQFEDDMFVLMLEDYWLTRPVNSDGVELMVDYMRRNSSILKGDICADRLYSMGANTAYDTHGYLDIVKSDPKSQYHMSLWPGMWNSVNLLKVLLPNESPHDLELTGTTRLREKFPELTVVGTRQNMVNITLGLRARDHSKVILNDLKPDDLSYLKENQMLLPWGVK